MHAKVETEENATKSGSLVLKQPFDLISLQKLFLFLTIILLGNREQHGR